MAATPKYRLLTLEELQSLEKEFVDYLVVNGITADEWVRIKESEKEKAEDIIALFSDVVFEGIMRKVKFLEFVSSQEVQTFQCLDSKMVLVGMRSKHPDHDFTNAAFISEAAVNPPQGIEIYTLDKSYEGVREVELFKMTENGCYISDGKLFKALSLGLS